MTNVKNGNGSLTLVLYSSSTNRKKIREIAMGQLLVELDQHCLRVPGALPGLFYPWKFFFVPETGRRGVLGNVGRALEMIIDPWRFHEFFTCWLSYYIKPMSDFRFRFWRVFSLLFRYAFKKMFLPKLMSSFIYYRSNSLYKGFQCKRAAICPAFLTALSRNMQQSNESVFTKFVSFSNHVLNSQIRICFHRLL